MSEESPKMVFRPARVVHVSSREELDSALLFADQVIVEGDDELLSYAAAKASHDPQLSRVDVEIAGRSISVGRDALGSSLVVGDSNRVVIVDSPGINESLPSLPPPPMAAAPRRSSLFQILGLSLVFVSAALAALCYLALPIHPNPTPSPSPSPASPSNVPLILQSLAWPAVAIAAILALFLIARQAIAGGRDVDISWKVTEKVRGRVVITKVRSRAKSARPAA